MRSRRKGKRATRKRIFAALLVCSAVGFLLPTSVTGRLMSLVQVLVPLQDATNRGADAIGTALVAAPEPMPSAADIGRMTVRNQSLRHTVITLRAEVDVLERTVRELAGIRDRGMPGRLVPARVAAPDVLSWRESQLIDAGTLQGVRRDAIVVSNHFTVNLGTEEGVRSGQVVLAAEAFIGTVEAVGTHTARVKLVSDPTTRMPVLIARGAEGPLDAEFWFVGAGGNRARIEDVDHRFIKEGGIQIGDGVLTVSGDDRLPVSMVIGSIQSIAQDKHNPLLYTLDVELAIDANRLRRVYVVDPIGE